MQMSGKIFSGVAVVAVVVLIGVAVGWFGASPGDSKQSNPSVNPATEKGSAASNPARPETKSPPAVSRKSPGNGLPATKTAPQTVAAPPPGGYITNWDDRLETILNSDGSETEKAKQMIAMYPRLPDDGKVEVVQHLSNLLEDKDYKDSGMGDWLKDPATPEDVLDALMADALNRPNATKLPLLLDIAKDPQHPKAEEAKDLLELYLEEDYGSDWSKWQAKTDEWLKQNPD